MIRSVSVTCLLCEWHAVVRRSMGCFLSVGVSSILSKLHDSCPTHTAVIEARHLFDCNWCCLVAAVGDGWQ